MSSVHTCRISIVHRVRSMYSIDACGMCVMPHVRSIYILDQYLPCPQIISINLLAHTTSPLVHITILKMPKIRDSKPKADIFEVTTTQTRRGRRIIQIPVQDYEPISSPTRSASPLKKQTWSPGAFEHDDYDNSATDQMPKRSRTFGKVHMNIHVNWY